MHPDMEDFLEEAFAALEPTSHAIGRVVVEPDYEAAVASQESQPLRRELVELLKGQATVDENALKSQGGLEVSIPSRYSMLLKYVRRVTLHADSVEGDWIEVVPPGYWI